MISLPDSQDYKINSRHYVTVNNTQNNYQKSYVSSVDMVYYFL